MKCENEYCSRINKKAYLTMTLMKLMLLIAVAILASETKAERLYFRLKSILAAGHPRNATKPFLFKHTLPYHAYDSGSEEAFRPIGPVKSVTKSLKKRTSYRSFMKLRQAQAQGLLGLQRNPISGMMSDQPKMLELKMPDPQDPHTVLALGKMTYNAYYEPSDKDWLKVPGWDVVSLSLIRGYYLAFHDIDGINI
jgi:putative lipase involved disintegration of autophagic bodies